MRPRPPELGDIFLLHVSLRAIEPAIGAAFACLRRQRAATSTRFLQVAVGWTDSHLHDFQVGDIRFGMTNTADELFAVRRSGHGEERRCVRSWPRD